MIIAILLVVNNSSNDSSRNTGNPGAGPPGD